MSTVVPGPTCTVLVEDDAHAPAARPATLVVHVRSTGDAPLDVVVSVRGLDDGWAPAPAVLEGLAPDATGTVRLTVTAPAGSVAGEYACAVVVATAPTGERVPPRQVVVPAVVTVDAPSRVVLAVEPAEARARISRQFTIVLSNSGEDPVDLELDHRADRGLRLEVPRRVHVGARSTVRLAGRAHVLRPNLVGHRDRRGYEMLAHGSQAPATFRGGVTAVPFLTAAMTRAFALVLVVAMWLGGLIVAVPQIRDLVGGEASPVAVAEPSTTPAPPDAPGAPVPGSDPDAPADDDSPSQLAGTVRAAGVVQAAAPGGVTVLLTPYGGVTTGPVAGGGATDASGSAAAPFDAAAPHDAAAPLGGAALVGAVRRTAAVAPLTRAALAAHAVAAAVPGDRSSSGPATTRTPAGALLPETTDLARERSTRTLDDGTWAVAGLNPTGTYLVVLSKPGYQTVRRVVTGAEAAEGIDADLVAGAGRLTGVVRGPDGAVGGASVTISDGTTTVTTSTRTRGDVGAWDVEGLSTPSTYLVTVSADGLGSASRLVTLAEAGRASVATDLVVGEASLTGRVTGPDGLGVVGAVGGATVVVRGDGVERTVTTATADGAGTYVVDGLPVPARYTVEVSAPGHTTVTSSVRLGIGRTASRDARLPAAGAAVQGAAVGSDGVGLGAVGITLTGAERTYKSMTSTEGSGAFRVGGMEPGRYVVTAESFGRVTSRSEVVVGPGGTRSVRLVLAESADGDVTSDARIRGRAVDARTNGQVSCSASTTEACLVTARLTAVAADGTTRTLAVTTTPDLEYTIPAAGEPGLLPGLYEVALSVPGYEPGTVRVEVPMGRTVTATNVALYPSPSVVGTVQARVGTVPDGTCVVVSPSGTPLPAGTTCTTGAASDGMPTCSITGPHRCGATGTNGAYQIERLRGGGYTVTVLPGDAEYVYPVVPSELTLVPGQVARFDATLERLGRIAVTALVDLGGSGLDPLVGARVTPVAADGTRGTTSVTASNGAVTLTHLRAGTYEVEVEAGDGSGSASATGVEVALNQEISRPVVIASAVNRFSGRVITYLDGSTPSGLGGRSVTVTGVVRYDGVTPVRGSATATTKPDGSFSVGSDAAGDALARLLLVSTKVDVTVAGDTVYEAQSLTGVTVTTNGTLTVELRPVARDFVGRVAFEGAGTADLVALARNVTFTVTAFPAGVTVHSPQVASGATAIAGAVALAWGDTTLGSTAAGSSVRPGRYVVEASLPGFVAQNVTYDVPVAGQGPVPVLVVTVRKHGVLAVRAVDEHTGERIADAVVTLTIGGATTTVRADGTAPVSFGLVAPGSYDVDVRAPGYRSVTAAQVAVQPGVTVAQATDIDLRRAGTIGGVVRVVEGTQKRTVEGVEVVASRGSTVLRTRTGAGGTYSVTGTADIEGLLPGTWNVTVTITGYTTAAAQVTVTDIDGGFTEPDVLLEPTLERTDVTIELVDVDNLGIDVGQVVVRGVSSTIPAPRCSDGTSQPCPDGLRTFVDVLPLPMNLLVTGAGGTTLTVQVTPTIGVSPPPTTQVPVTGRKNTVRVTVAGQAGAAQPTPVLGATVELRDASDAVVGGPGAAGPGGAVYVLDGVDAGDYTLHVEATGYATATRAVSVTGGVTLSVDIVLSTSPRQVGIELRSVRGSDLTGAVVVLEPAGGGAAETRLALGAQPVVRQGDDRFGTTFTQVPPGAWRLVVTGPAGHLWQLVRSVPASGGDTVTVDVAEVRARALVAASPDFVAEGGGRVLARVEPGGGEVGGFTGTTLAVVPGAGHEEVWLLRGDGDHVMTATIEGGATIPWRVVGTPTVDPVTGDLTLVGGLEPETQTVTATATGGSVSVDAPSATIGVTVTAPKNVPAPHGTAVVTLRRGGTTLAVGTAPVTGGSASVSVPLTLAGLTAGTWDVYVAFTSGNQVRWTDTAANDTGADLVALAVPGAFTVSPPAAPGWVRGATFSLGSSRGAVVTLTHATCVAGALPGSATVTIAAGATVTCTVAAGPATELTVTAAPSSLPVNVGWEVWTGPQTLGTVAAEPPTGGG